MIEQISNLESAASVRAKLNQLITAVNYLNSITGSSSNTSGTAGTSGTQGYTPPTSGTSGTQGYTPPPAGSSGSAGSAGSAGTSGATNFSVQFYGSNPMGNAVGTSIDACTANNTGMSRMVYVQDNTPSGTPNQPAMGDRVYSDYTYTTTLGAGWYGFRNTIMMMNYAVQIDASGFVMMVSPC
jgi:hypothetical protein